MIKDFAKFLTRLTTAAVFTSLLISCQKISQNQPSNLDQMDNQVEYGQSIETRFKGN